MIHLTGNLSTQSFLLAMQLGIVFVNDIGVLKTSNRSRFNSNCIFHFSDPSIELNLVSCQFAFHYCFESPKQAEMMLKNVSECLRVGGYFIGTIPDAFDIMKRQRKADSDSFGNDIFQIKFLSDPNDLPIFGAKYNFHLDGVVDCPEFLVYFPALVKLAKKYSLKLIENVRFEDYFQSKIGRGKGLIEKMQAVERYGLHANRNMSRSNEEEYKHAKDFLLQKGGYENRRRCGTLSASEWEAACKFLLQIVLLRLLLTLHSCSTLHDLRFSKSQRTNRVTIPDDLGERNRNFST